MLQAKKNKISIRQSFSFEASINATTDKKILKFNFQIDENNQDAAYLEIDFSDKKLRFSLEDIINVHNTLHSLKEQEAGRSKRIISSLELEPKISDSTETEKVWFYGQQQGRNFEYSIHSWIEISTQKLLFSVEDTSRLYHALARYSKRQKIEMVPINSVQKASQNTLTSDPIHKAPQNILTYTPIYLCPIVFFPILVSPQDPQKPHRIPMNTSFQMFPPRQQERFLPI